MTGNLDWEERTKLLLGKEKLNKLKNSNVLIVGLGGVGGYAAEAICRAGVRKMTIVDGDTINDTNKNRQLLALNSTNGQEKAKIMEKRLKDIAPDVELNVINEFLRDEHMINVLDKGNFDYVVDAIDTLSPKIYLIYHSIQKNIPIVSSMGAGGKLNPELVSISDISKSYNCNLARALRKRLNRLGIRKGFKVVFSPEEVDPASVIIEENAQNKKSNVGTISYMPAIFGLYCSSVVINDLLIKKNV